MTHQGQGVATTRELWTGWWRRKSRPGLSSWKIGAFSVQPSSPGPGEKEGGGRTELLSAVLQPLLGHRVLGEVPGMWVSTWRRPTEGGPHPRQGAGLLSPPLAGGWREGPSSAETVLSTLGCGLPAPAFPGVASLAPHGPQTIAGVKPCWPASHLWPFWRGLFSKWTLSSDLCPHLLQARGARGHPPSSGWAMEGMHGGSAGPEPTPPTPSSSPGSVGSAADPQPTGQWTQGAPNQHHHPVPRLESQPGSPLLIPKPEEMCAGMQGVEGGPRPHQGGPGGQAGPFLCFSAAQEGKAPFC